jgi:hypothetical protein
MKKLLLLLALILVFLCLDEARGWKQCEVAEGSGVCPDFSACCPTDTPGLSSCISVNSKYSQYTPQCCSDGVTGCGGGYECADDAVYPFHSYCKLGESHPPDAIFDLPRYRLATYPKDPTMLKTVYGFPMDDEFQAAYYSSQGEMINTPHETVERLILVIHGSKCNPPDYIYAAYSALPRDMDPSTVMIVAPNFVTNADGSATEQEATFQTTDDSRTVLEWHNYSKEAPHISPTFRWGADAKNAPGISSFDVLDRMVEYFMQHGLEYYPALQEIVVTGHSAGGQFTQRWALMSHSFAWDLTVKYPTTTALTKRFLADDDPSGNSYLRQRNTIPVPSLKVVPANPRSFAYLDERRWINGTIMVPPNVEVECPSYNKWIWGFEHVDDDEDWIPFPYRDRGPALSAKELSERYNERFVIYLQGVLDKVPLRARCEEQIQGNYRLERGQHFYSYLREYFGDDLNHEMYEVESPHDHTLMYQSQLGQLALFGKHD